MSIQPLVMPLDDYYSRRGLNHLSPKHGLHRPELGLGRHGRDGRH